MTVLEKEIEAKLRKMVESHGGLCLKWLCPGWAGVPDRIILLPGGWVIFAETKRTKGGRLSARQKWWGRTLVKLGFRYYTIWTESDVTALETVIKAEG